MLMLARDANGIYRELLSNDNGALILSASENHLGEIGGHLITAAASLTRPANTTAYTALDAVANSTSAPTVLTFADLARIAGGSGHIIKARLMTNQSTCTARFRLHLYNVAPTAINDNAACTLLWANRASHIGYIDFSACATEGAGSDCAHAVVVSGTSNLPLAFTCAADSNLYGLLETLDGFTPASAQAFHIELSAEVN